MAILVNLPRQRIFPLRDVLRARGFTHKIVITYADLNATPSTTNQYVQLLPTPVNWLLTAAESFSRTAFAPNIFSGAANFALTTDTSGPTAVILALPNAGIFPICGPSTTLNTGTTSVPLYLLMTSAGANFTTLTAGELWIFLTLLDVNLIY